MLCTPSALSSLPSARLRTEQGPITTEFDYRDALELQPDIATNICGYGSLRSQGRRKRVPHHDRNSRVYCVSWRRLARSARKVALPRSSSEDASARLAVAATSVSRLARMRWLSVCPSGTRRAPAEIQFDTSACRKACMVGAAGIACAALTRPTAMG